MKYTITAFSENSAGVLYRMSNLFLRRKINIDSLTVSETETKGISRFTIVADISADTVEKLVKQLYRIIEVSKVYESTDDDIVFSEVALIKVHTKSAEARREIVDLASLHGASVVHTSADSLVLRHCDGEDKVSALIELLRPFGLKETVRSGRVAMVR